MSAATVVLRSALLGGVAGVVTAAAGVVITIIFVNSHFGSVSNIPDETIAHFAARIVLVSCTMIIPLTISRLLVLAMLRRTTRQSAKGLDD